MWLHDPYVIEELLRRRAEQLARADRPRASAARAVGSPRLAGRA